jgi:hypothetical protein
MKPLSLIAMLLCVASLSFGQTLPDIKALTTTLIVGSAGKKEKVHLETNNTDPEDYSVTADNEGNFTQAFNPPLTVGQYILVWTEDSEGHLSTKFPFIVKSNDEALKSILAPTEFTAAKINIENLRAANLLYANQTVEYKATIWNTNFSLPVVRFDFVSDNPLKKGNVALFSSIGAGFGFSLGRWEVTRNNVGEITNESFSNSFSIHMGAIYASTTGENERNVFAPIINIGFSDVQIGLGYDFGTVAANQKRTFLTFSYAIPLYKLTKTNYRVFLRTKNPISVK